MAKQKTQAHVEPDRAIVLAKSKGTILLTAEDSAAQKALWEKLGIRYESAVCREPDGTPFAEIVKSKHYRIVARAY